MLEDNPAMPRLVEHRLAEQSDCKIIIHTKGKNRDVCLVWAECPMSVFPGDCLTSSKCELSALRWTQTDRWCDCTASAHHLSVIMCVYVNVDHVDRHTSTCPCARSAWLCLFQSSRYVATQCVMMQQKSVLSDPDRPITTSSDPMIQPSGVEDLGQD